MSSLRINPAGVAKLREDEGDTDRLLAIRLGLDPGTTNRVLRGKRSPGEKFIAGFIKAFGAHRLLDIFDIVDS